MFTTKIGVEKFLQIITLYLVPLLIIPAAILGGDTDNESMEESKVQSDFSLAIKDNLIYLDAKDASLVEIVKEIGGKMKIDVIAKVPDEERVTVTVKVEELPLEAAMERLREFADIAYIKDSENDDAKITKILVFPKGKAEERVNAREESMEKEALREEAKEEEAGKKEARRPEPFKFEFDPSEFEEEY